MWGLLSIDRRSRFGDLPPAAPQGRRVRQAGHTRGGRDAADTPYLQLTSATDRDYRTLVLPKRAARAWLIFAPRFAQRSGEQGKPCRAR